MKDNIIAFGKVILFFAIVVIIVGVLFYATGEHMMKYKESTVYLQELEDGIYAYNETIVSNVPANNYSIVTFCSTKGNVISVRGSVTIVYIDPASAPCAIWVNYYNMKNSDEVTLYVPQGSVKYFGSSGTGK